MRANVKHRLSETENKPDIAHGPRGDRKRLNRTGIVIRRQTRCTQHRCPKHRAGNAAEETVRASQEFEVVTSSQLWYAFLGVSQALWGLSSDTGAERTAVELFDSNCGPLLSGIELRSFKIRKIEHRHDAARCHDSAPSPSGERIPRSR